MFMKKWRKKTSADAFMEGVNIHQTQGPSRSRHYMLIACIGFIVILVIWAYFSKIDEVTKGTGKVVPSGKIQVLQHLEGGIVEKIVAREGDNVKKGQILMEIDDVNYTAIYREGLIKTAAIQARVARLTAEAYGKPFKLNPEFEKAYPNYSESEYSAYLANRAAEKSKMTTALEQLNQRQEELAALEAHIKKLNDSLKLVAEEHKMVETLYRDGAAAKVEVLRSKRQVSDLRGEIRETELNKSRANGAILEAKSKLEEIKQVFRSQAAKELVEAKAELASQEQTNITLQDRARRTILRAPVDGIINRIHVNTIGGTVKPGEDLIEIVPEGETLLVEVNIKPRDIAFIHPEQNATVKLTAYDFLIYGGLKAKVERIGADSITDKEGNSFYVVRVRTDKDFLGTKKKPLPIIPGMTAEVDILTGKRSLLTYILKPLLRGSKQALGER